MYYRNANGVLCTFDIANRDSFNRVSSYLEDFRKCVDASLPSSSSCAPL
jgi:GTPase SAR1 family protein